MRQTLFVVAMAWLVGMPVQAHHSYGGFYLDRTATVEGTLDRVHYGNPHTVLVVRVEEGLPYTVLWRPASQLRGMGVGPTTLRAGDQIVVTGSPSRDPLVRQLVTIREVRRSGDGWIWRLQGGRVTVDTGSDGRL